MANLVRIKHELIDGAMVETIIPLTAEEVQIELAQRASNKVINDAFEAKQAARAADLVKLANTQADAALTEITSDLAAINTALNVWPTATNAQKIDMIQPLLQGLKRAVLRQELVIKGIRWLVND